MALFHSQTRRHMIKKLITLKCNCYIYMFLYLYRPKVGEYDPELPQSETTNQPTVDYIPEGR